MKCSKCGSENVMVVSEQTKGKTKVSGTSPLRKFGRFFMIFITCGLWLLVPKKKVTGKTKYKNDTVAICQNCGHKWKV